MNNASASSSAQNPACLLRSLVAWHGYNDGAHAVLSLSPEFTPRSYPVCMRADCPWPALLAQAQVCAAGALLNILGPVLGDTPLQRRALGRLLAVVHVLSTVRTCVFDQPSLLA